MVTADKIFLPFGRLRWLIMPRGMGDFSLVTGGHRDQVLRISGPGKSV